MAADYFSDYHNLSEIDYKTENRDTKSSINVKRMFNV